MARSSGAKRKNTQRVKDFNGEQRFSRHETDWKFDWYQPEGRQQDIIDAMDENELVIVNAPSGCGKSSTIIYKALQDYRAHTYRKILLIKTPSEAGDDQIGYLSGDKNTKLSAHMDSMKKLFQQFMSNNKLENDISNGNIVLDIPNYILGSTFDDTLIILEEAQTMSPETIKLCAERAGRNSKVVIAGDSKQRYSAKKREDGLKDLIGKVTHENHGYRFSNYSNVGYIEMDSTHNMRSDLSKFITDIYA